MKNRKPNPKRDNKNWQILFKSQFDNLQRTGKISQLWINGLCKLGIDNTKVPTVEDLNRVSRHYTGWTFIQTKDVVITGAEDWNRLIVKKTMPVTSFVRTPAELDYCDEPDKWHDIIGHIPFLMSQDYTNMYLNISQLYLDAARKGKKFADQVYSLISFIIEVGIIEENNQLKAFGATLYSSSGELKSAFTKSNYKPFSLEKVLSLNYYDRSKIQKNYFIVDSLKQINQIVKIYREKYLD